MADGMKLVMADDLAGRLDGWLQRVRGVGLVDSLFGPTQPLTGGDLALQIEELSQRRAAARKGAAYVETPTAFDDADLLIVDYDLTELDGHSTQTGVGVAYLARCFSDCGYIVALNQFGDNPFDLSGLGDYAGFADLDIGGEQLSNPGLWTSEEEWDEFRPWSWPVLPAEVARLAQLTEELLGRGLDAPIFETLGLRDRLITAFAPEAAAPLGRQPAVATFLDLLNEPTMGLRKGDEIPNVERRARAAAARASQWLERWVLAAQDRLIDAPHLAVRYPSQILSESEVVRAVQHGTNTGLRYPLSAHQMAAPQWLSRPTWWAASVAGDEAIPEVADPWETRSPERIFLEDTSALAAPNDGVAYRIEVPADSRLRFVRRTEGVDYRPVSNFARA